MTTTKQTITLDQTSETENFSIKSLSFSKVSNMGLDIGTCTLDNAFSWHISQLKVSTQLQILADYLTYLAAKKEMEE